MNYEIARAGHVGLKTKIPRNVVIVRGRYIKPRCSFSELQFDEF